MRSADKIKNVIFSNMDGAENCCFEDHETGEALESCYYEKLYGYCDCSNIAYDAELENLDFDLDENILCIASLGLWDGIKDAYKEMDNNLNNILSNLEDRNIVYSDGKDIRAKCIHHDGTNFYLYRVLKPGVNTDKFYKKIYDGTYTWDDVLKYTKSVLPYVKEVYGWK
jgi:hypothetical protein